jgi:uncharacterized protein (DUF362 family)
VTRYEERAALASAVRRGLDAVGTPALKGKVFVKPNLVMPHHRVGKANYTRPEIARAVVEALLEREPDARFTFGGNSGLGVPTAVMARRAAGSDPELALGYWALERLFPGAVRISPTDEAPLRGYRLSRGPLLTLDEREKDAWHPEDPRKRFWDVITTSGELETTDHVLFLPKLKSNVLSHGLTAAVKLGGIGLLTDRDRLKGHNHLNDRRIADMLEIAEPDLIVTDAVEVAIGGNQMTEPGYPLGAVIVASNALAHDTVAAAILGLDARKIGHLAIAHARGYGPIDLDAIDVVGDVTIDELRARLAKVENGFFPVDKFGERYHRDTGLDFPMEILTGPPYEHAGAHGVLLDWLYMTHDFPEARDGISRWPRGTCVAGEFQGFPKNSLVYCVGKRACAKFRSQVQSLFGLRIPLPVWKQLRGFRSVERWRKGKRRGIAFFFEGDPPSHKDLVLGFFLASLGRMRVPLFRPDLIFDSYVKMMGTVSRHRKNNAGGIPIVETRDIARVRARTAELEGASARPKRELAPV